MLHNRIRRFAAFVLTTMALGWPDARGQTPALPDWSMSATVIEACSCPLFCPTYFGTKPAAHPEGLNGEAKYYCRFNSAFQVKSGKFGRTKLDGIHFWLAGDRGEDLSRGQMDWASLIFEKSMTQEQREAISAIVGFVIPVQFKSVALSEGQIQWELGAEDASAVLDGGKTAEIRLKRFPSINPDEPVLLKNLRYWGAPRNDGFVIMQATVEAYRVGYRPFEFRDTTGFTTTIDITSKDSLPGAGR
jgi:Protein of unknown function (DUF1326)